MLYNRPCIKSKKSFVYKTMPVGRNTPLIIFRLWQLAAIKMTSTGGISNGGNTEHQKTQNCSHCTVCSTCHQPCGTCCCTIVQSFVQADMESVVVENNRIAAKEETVDSRDTTVSSTLSLRTTSAQRTTVSSLGAVPAFDTVTQLSSASSTSMPVESTVSDTVKSTAKHR